MFVMFVKDLAVYVVDNANDLPYLLKIDYLSSLVHLNSALN